MAYEATGLSLSAAEVGDIVAIGQRVDLTPGPGGAKIAPVWGEARAACLDILRLDLDRTWPVVSMVALYPSRQISAHCDPSITGRRLHIPLIANPSCWSFHGGTWQQLALGHAYEMDPTVEHGAVNWGATMRLHLIVDTES